MKDLLKDILYRLSSRKFLVVVACFALILLDSYHNISLTPEQKLGLIGTILSYVGIEGYLDAKSQGNE